MMMVIVKGLGLCNVVYFEDDLYAVEDETGCVHEVHKDMCFPVDINNVDPFRAQATRLFNVGYQDVAYWHISAAKKTLLANEKTSRALYGKLGKHFVWDLAVDFFKMSNDMFFDKYGFNYVPRGSLFDKAKEHVHAPKIELKITPQITQRVAAQKLRSFRGHFNV